MHGRFPVAWHAGGAQGSSRLQLAARDGGAAIGGSAAAPKVDDENEHEDEDDRSAGA